MANLKPAQLTQLQHKVNTMNKKQAIVNTLYGKIQNRSKNLFEDVSNEMWSFDDKPAEKDYDLEIDGDTVEEDDDKEEEKQVSALDVILDAPVEDSEKEVKEF